MHFDKNSHKYENEQRLHMVKLMMPDDDFDAVVSLPNMSFNWESDILFRLTWPLNCSAN